MEIVRSQTNIPLDDVLKIMAKKRGMKLNLFLEEKLIEHFTPETVALERMQINQTRADKAKEELTRIGHA